MKTTPHPSVQPDFCLISKPVRIALGLSVAVLLALPLGLEAQSNCVPAASGLVGWWRGEGNGSDQAGTNNGTLAGNTTFGPGRVGQAFVFDGIGDAVVVGSAPNLQFQDLTIETWVKRTSTSAVSLAGNGNAVLFGYGQGGYGLYLSPAGQPALSKIGVDSVISSQSITDINFHHLAVTKSGSTIVFYIDGVAYPAPAYNPGFVFSTVTAIGARGDNLDNSFLGAIDELSVYNRALSAADIQAIYNAGGLGKCPPSPPTNCVPVPSGLASWWRAEGNALDQTGANNGTTSGNVTFVPGRVGQAFFFDGLGPVIHLGNPASLQVQDFTIEAWISRASTSAASRDGNGNGQIFGYDIGGYSLYLDPSGQPTLSHTGVDAVGAGVSITDTSFHHLAVAKSGTTVVFYIDGVARPPASYNAAFTFSNQAFIGGIGNSINFYGTVDELAFYSRALSVAEVQAIYNADGAGKCPTGTAPSILTQPQSVTTSVGGTASFSVTALGTAPLSYQWRKNGTNILDATSTAYTILNVQTSDAGIYAVLVTNSFAPPVLSSNAVLTVTPTPTNCIAAPANMVSWWRAEGNALDQTGANNGTTSGNVPFVSGRVGQAFFFDGLGPVIQLGNPISLQVQDFTIEAWISRASTSVASRDGNGNGQIFGYDIGGYSLYLDPSGQPTLSHTGVDAVGAGVSITDTSFHHVAVAKSGSTVVFYVDGVARPAATYNTAFTFSNQAFIGGIGNSINFYGTVDELSFYNRALSAAEIQAVHNADGAGKCPAGTPPANCAPVSSGLVAWWPFQSNAVDVVGGHNGTVTGNVAFASSEVGFGLSITSAPGGAVVSDSPDLDFGPGVDFSIEAWIRPMIASTVFDAFDIVDKRLTPSDSTAIGYELDLVGGKLEMEISNSLTKPYLIVGPVGPDLRDGAWHHVALTLQRTSTTGGKFYADGQLVATFDPSSQQGDLTTGQPLLIGLHPAYPRLDLNFRGGIDELSVYRRAISAAEVQAIYNAGSAGKCAISPTNCIAAPANIVSWWRAEGNGDDFADGNAATLLNGVGFTNGVVGQAFNLDGVDDRIIVSNSPSLNFPSSQSFSIESWIRPLPSPTDFDVMDIVDKRLAPDTTHSQGYTFYLLGGRIACRLSDSITGDGSAFGPAGPDLRDGAFHHVAVTVARNATTGGRLYVDGQVVMTFDPTVEPGDLSNSEPFRIGNHPTPSVSAFFKGQIDEVTLYNRALGTDEIQGIYNAGGGGKCITATAAPFISSQPANQTVTVGGTASFSVVAGGTPPLSYQWFFNSSNLLAGATTSSLMISNAQLTNAGSYSVLVSNAITSVLSSDAVLTVNPGPTVLRVADTSAASGGTVTVPVMLTANGTENALSFSLNFAPSRLAYVSTTLSNGAGATFFVNESQTATGRLGMALALPTGSTFPPGAQEVAEVTFTAGVVTESTPTTISFVDQPIVRQVSDAGGHALPATYTSGNVSIAGVVYEADVSPRPNGDQLVTVTDWVLIGRFVAHLDNPANGSEFQRADCAPRASLGDGRLSIIDWVQAGRYAAGLDPLTIAGGPTSQVSVARVPVVKSGGPRPLSGRQVQAGGAVLNQGQRGAVSISLQALGDENALGFTVVFDPTQLTYTGVSLGSGAIGATLNANIDEASAGRVGFALALSSGHNFAAGLNELVKLTFQASVSATNNTSLAFGDDPIYREISDSAANALTADYVSGTIVVNPLPTLRIWAANQGIGLAWPSWATNFVLQQTTTGFSSPGNWTNVSVNVTTTTNNESIVNLPIGGTTKFYRLLKQ